MKIVFLVSSFGILYMMTLQPGVKNTYDKSQDTFRITFLIVPCAVLATLVNHEFTPLEVRSSCGFQRSFIRPTACSLYMHASRVSIRWGRVFVSGWEGGCACGGFWSSRRVACQG